MKTINIITAIADSKFISILYGIMKGWLARDYRTRYHIGNYAIIVFTKASQKNSMAKLHVTFKIPEHYE